LLKSLSGIKLLGQIPFALTKLPIRFRQRARSIFHGLRFVSQSAIRSRGAVFRRARQAWPK
jgi:hypothetical protein